MHSTYMYQQDEHIFKYGKIICIFGFDEDKSWSPYRLNGRIFSATSEASHTRDFQVNSSCFVVQ